MGSIPSSTALRESSWPECRSFKLIGRKALPPRDGRSWRMLPRYRRLGVVQGPALVAGRPGKTRLSIQDEDPYSSRQPRVVQSSRNSLRIESRADRTASLMVAAPLKKSRRLTKSSRSMPPPADQNGTLHHRPESITVVCFQQRGDWCFGASGGVCFAVDADTGREVWRVSLGGYTKSAPISFMVDGRQVIAIAAGHALFVFAL